MGKEDRLLEERVSENWEGEAPAEPMSWVKPKRLGRSLAASPFQWRASLCLWDLNSRTPASRRSRASESHLNRKSGNGSFARDSACSVFWPRLHLRFRCDRDRCAVSPRGGRFLRPFSSASMVGFFITATLAILAINTYIGFRLVSTSALAKRWRLVGWSCIAILAVGPPLLFAVGRARGEPSLEVALSVGWILFGITIVLFPAVVLRDLLGTTVFLTRKLRRRKVDQQRRVFFARALNIATLGATASALGIGVAGALRRAVAAR